MSNYTDAQRFLQAVFGTDYGTHAIFAHTPDGKWTHTRSLAALDGTSDCYWCIAAFAPGHLERTKSRALEVRALVIDDVGNFGHSKVKFRTVRAALGDPTACLLTSGSNYQWGYRLSAPVPIDQWGAFFAGVEKLVGQKLDGGDAVHVFRLPMGVNTKPGRKNYAAKLTVLMAGKELDVTKITPIAPRPGPSGDGAEIKMNKLQLEKLMALIPNDLHRDDWVEAGHGLKAMCKEDDEGLEVFDAWSQLHASYDAAHTRDKWSSFGASGLRTKGGLLRARAERLDPDGFRKWEAGAVFDDGTVPPTVPPQGAVRFRRGRNNEILATKENAELGLAGLKVECSYDEFHHRVYIRGREKLTDHVVLLLRHELNRVYGKDFGTVNIGDAVVTLALLNGFNPVCDMLRGAEALWDGVKRLDRLGPDYFHTEDSELARACFRKTMLAAVRRARQPGVKFDQILVTESPEGWDKSSAWAVLAGEGNFSDADILGKDARAVQEELADVWIHEIADLSGLSRADVEHVKAFASRVNDRARPAYGRYLVDQPRQSIEVGTTNSNVYMLSPSGNRRFWPFRLGSPVDLYRLRADRLQLWGEAAAAESAGETLVLDRALWGAAEAAQEERRVVDPWEDELANLPDTLVKDVAGMQTITNVAIHDYLGGYRGGQLSGAAGRKISEIMKRLGWERAKLRDALGKEVRGYKRGTDMFGSVGISVQKNIF